jgi:S-adenosylmethionine-diacylgycerolhomoserine-N-methlytransferase
MAALSPDAGLLMDRIYRHQRAIYDISRRYYLLGRDRLIAGLAPGPGAAILEIGCGTGRNLVHCARRYPQARLYGLDVSTAMLETAGRALCRAGLTGQVRLGLADATRLDTASLFGQPRFERIFISYSLSMIPVWREVADRALATLAPGGELHIVDFGQQEGMPAVFRRLLFAWLRLFSVTPVATLRWDLRTLAERHAATLDFRTLYRGYAVLAVLRKRA